ncbi:MAG: hypothetical protein K0S76_1276 [Herbinix sp.]|jgi:putative protease|nr:hypothetical protein [Herbinix sp.]
MMNRQIEILAPAGSYEGMRAAMNAGCDAVYIGGSSFGARAYADNPDTEGLLRAIDEAHIRNKQLYLTVNTLLKEQELESKLYSFLEPFYMQGLDAVIVQDVGVMNSIHKHFPGLPIHASTQMTLTMAEGANLLKNYGVTRLVTSRELSLNEIKNLREKTELEIETFVHGALCYCYSGQCLMSSVIGGRSGNRGRCAQPCRMQYQFFSGDKQVSSNREKYLLSPKDINTVAILPELIEAGINSFKIEGRMKRPEYAAAVASLYRNYVNLYYTLGKEEYRRYLQRPEFKTDMIKLQDVFNRGGFSQGYGETYNGKKMMSMGRPNHSGVSVGEVTKINGSQVSITLKENVNAQDILEIRETEEDGYEFTVKDSLEQGKTLATNVGKRPDLRRNDSAKEAITKQNVRFQKGKERDRKDKWLEQPKIHIGDKVYRTKNNYLLEQLANEYMKKDAKLGMKGHLRARSGEKLALSITCMDLTITAYHNIVEEALKQPMTKEKLLNPLIKTGDTLFFFEEFNTDTDDNIFVPVAWLNEIRRDAIRLLEEAVIARYRRNGELLRKDKPGYENTKPSSGAEAGEAFGVCISVKTKEQFAAAISFEEVTAIYVEYDTLSMSELLAMAEEAISKKKAYFLVLPHICRSKVYEKVKRDIVSFIDSKNVSGFIVKNFEEIALLQSLYTKEGHPINIRLNHNMYVFNREAKSFWNKMGIAHFTAPVELNYSELKELQINDCDMIIYGYMPLMVSAQCLFENCEGCRKRNKGAQNNSGFLLDRLGMKFYVETNCNGCYNIIYNGQCLSLLRQASEVKRLRPANLRLDFTMETKEETKKVVQAFLDTYLYDRENTYEIPNNTAVHFKRGVE